MPATKSSRGAKKSSKGGAKSSTKRGSTSSRKQRQAGTPGGRSGVYLRRSDGNHYFVPESALETFQVTSTSGQALLQDAAASQGQSGGPTYEASHVQLQAETGSGSGIYPADNAQIYKGDPRNIY